MEIAMKNLLIFLIFGLFLLFGCSSDPADTNKSTYNPAVHTLEKIEGLDGSKTLVLSAMEPEALPAPQNAMMGDKTINSAIPPQCDEIGEISGGRYQKLPLQGSITPCFKKFRRWRKGGNAVYGQYTPFDSTEDVWFITDEQGKVHHLPGAPSKDNGFKNERMIRKLNGHPVYLNQLRRLVKFNLTTDKEEYVIDDTVAVGRFVVIDKPSDGEHIVYTDLTGGQRKKPSDDVDRLAELDTYKFFFKNPSGDLTYIASSYFKRMIFDATGNITDRAASAVPVEFEEWLNGGQGVAMPTGPVFGGSLEDCEMSENLMICGVKGFVIKDSTADIEEVNWNVFEIYGSTPQVCLQETYIYFAAGDKLTKITRDLSSFEHIITGEEINELSCLADGNLLIKTPERTYQFDPVNRITTILPDSISGFVN
jgi:hypothetical protein